MKEERESACVREGTARGEGTGAPPGGAEGRSGNRQKMPKARENRAREQGEAFTATLT